MISILGSGAFGTALAVSLCAAHKEVRLWGRDPDQTKLIQKTREHTRRLPGVTLPENLSITKPKR